LLSAELIFDDFIDIEEEEVDFDIPLVDEPVVFEPEVVPVCAMRAGASVMRPVRVAIAIRLLFLLMCLSTPFLSINVAEGIKRRP
jgi:hypothetical protein